MWSGDICILCIVDSCWPRGNGGIMVAIWCAGMNTHVPVCVISLVWFAKLVYSPENDIYSLSGLFTGLQENVK